MKSYKHTARVWNALMPESSAYKIIEALPISIHGEKLVLNHSGEIEATEAFTTVDEEKAKILILKRVKGVNITEAVRKSRKHFPNLKLVTYRFCQNYQSKKGLPKGAIREIDLVIVDDSTKIFEEV